MSENSQALTVPHLVQKGINLVVGIGTYTTVCRNSLNSRIVGVFRKRTYDLYLFFCGYIHIRVALLSTIIILIFEILSRMRFLCDFYRCASHCFCVFLVKSINDFSFHLARSEQSAKHINRCEVDHLFSYFFTHLLYPHTDFKCLIDSLHRLFACPSNVVDEP